MRKKDLSGSFNYHGFGVLFSLFLCKKAFYLGWVGGQMQCNDRKRREEKRR